MMMDSSKIGRQISLFMKFSRLMVMLLISKLIIIMICPLITEMVCLVVGIFYVLGWEIGGVEAISLSILVGSSVDYCVHLVEGYILAAKSCPVKNVSIILLSVKLVCFTCQLN